MTTAVRTLVNLDEAELVYAAHVGIRRQIEAVSRALPDRNGYDGLGWDVHIEGACGELALAKFLGRYWSASNGSFRRAADVGRLEVRTRSRHDYELIIRPDDDPMKYYALVTGRAPSYRIRGFLLGEDARRPEWWQTHGGRPAAWFVPTEQLRTDWP